MQRHSVGIDPGKTTFSLVAHGAGGLPLERRMTFANTLAKLSIEMPEILENATKCI